MIEHDYPELPPEVDRVILSAIEMIAVLDQHRRLGRRLVDTLRAIDASICGSPLELKLLDEAGQTATEIEQSRVALLRLTSQVEQPCTVSDPRLRLTIPEPDARL